MGPRQRRWEIRFVKPASYAKKPAKPSFQALTGPFQAARRQWNDGELERLATVVSAALLLVLPVTMHLDFLANGRILLFPQRLPAVAVAIVQVHLAHVAGFERTTAAAASQQQNRTY